MFWLFKVWKYIREDKAEHYRTQMSLMPLSRTPMDKKSAEAIDRYSRQVSRALESLTPWRTEPGRGASLHGKAQPGKVVVILEGNERLMADDPLFADANVSRE